MRHHIRGGGGESHTDPDEDVDVVNTILAAAAPREGGKKGGTLRVTLCTSA